ncbi:MAG: hypothetical protein HOU81_23545 [Hamadaea sp.]|uniref:hypothetical protein n=1 Tax=Hamadaea sp. TaxID=2024425 RepID=UPI00179B2232|nr:hypothetical protein [Hamadaea sp.]NUR73799.1 hypothetical protein [Hamadaea sp.]NUT22411.1 hypothetical protein [Hamadaea sp.]
MNPLRVIQREVAGAWRSVRYDLRKRSASPDSEKPVDPWADSWSETEVELRAPRAVAPPPPKGHRRSKAKGPRPSDPVRSPARQRMTLVAAGLVLLALSAGGVLAMITGMRALLDPGAPPAALPAHAAPAPSPVGGSPEPVAVLTSAPATSQVTKRPHATTKTPKPPVPTPAPVPTCSCTQPPSPGTSASPSPSGTPTPSPSGVTSPTATAGPTEPPGTGATR